jgi:hypothetical protein
MMVVVTHFWVPTQKIKIKNKKIIIYIYIYEYIWSEEIVKKIITVGGWSA